MNRAFFLFRSETFSESIVEAAMLRKNPMYFADCISCFCSFWISFYLQANVLLQYASIYKVSISLWRSIFKINTIFKVCFSEILLENGILRIHNTTRSILFPKHTITFCLQYKSFKLNWVNTCYYPRNATILALLDLLWEE